MSASGTLGRYFRDYSGYHQTPGNKFCHRIGIPMIMGSLLGLLASWVIAGGDGWLRLDGGVLLLVAAMVWYAYLDWRLALGFLPYAIAHYAVGRALPTWALWAVFVGGWIFQGIGHAAYEKKSPAFFKNVEHLLIGPFWVFAGLIGYRPRS